jgi:hypothetical protein
MKKENSDQKKSPASHDRHKAGSKKSAAMAGEQARSATDRVMPKRGTTSSQNLSKTGTNVSYNDEE